MSGSTVVWLVLLGVVNAFRTMRLPDAQPSTAVEGTVVA
jgi:hypothetical protein